MLGIVEKTQTRNQKKKRSTKMLITHDEVVTNNFIGINLKKMAMLPSWMHLIIDQILTIDLQFKFIT